MIIIIIIIIIIKGIFFIIAIFYKNHCSKLNELNLLYVTLPLWTVNG